MRAISFIIALAAVMATNTMAGTPDTLPGAGTFSWEGATPIVQPTRIASR